MSCYDLADEIVSLLQNIQKLQLDSLITNAFEQFKRLLQGIYRRQDIRIICYMSRTGLTKHVIDEASGAFDVITPPVSHHFIIGFQLEKWTVKRIKKHGLCFGPGLICLLIDKGLYIL